METIIHIGQHKTGTTSLQKLLKANKSNLEKIGIFYPSKILKFNQASHFILNVYALKSARSSSMKDVLLKRRGPKYIKKLATLIPPEIKKIYLEAESKKCKRIIWSNEGLYLLDSISEYEKLKKLFNSFSSKITVVCCFREKESYLKSYLAQLTERGLTALDDPTSYRFVAENSWLCNYERKKELLSEVFDETIFYDYNENDSIKPFLDNLNINLDYDKSIKLNVTNYNNTEQ